MTNFPPPLAPIPLTAATARRLEERFLADFARGLKRHEHLPDPGGGRPVRRTRCRRQRVFLDRRIERERDALRLDRAIRPDHPPGAIHLERWTPRRGPALPLIVAAAAVHHDPDYLRGGFSARPAGPEALRAVVDRVAMAPWRHAWIAVLSPTGWRAEVVAHPLDAAGVTAIPVRHDPVANRFVFLPPETDAMPLFETIRRLFRGAPPTQDSPPVDPDDDPSRLLARLETVRAANEHSLEALEEEIERLRAALGTIAPDSARGRPIARRIEHCRQRSAIHRHNLRISGETTARLEQIEALGATGVEPGQIETVAALYERRLESSLATGEAAESLLRLSPAALLGDDEEAVLLAEPSTPAELSGRLPDPLEIEPSR
jgi:hypothetical protein